MTFHPIPLVASSFPKPKPCEDWLWHGFLKPGNVTLLTSQWKSGKTTLITGLLQKMHTGEPFLDLPVKRTRAWILSEESQQLWAERIRGMPLGEGIQLLSRPFRTRPSVDQWLEFFQSVIEERQSRGLDLLVIDPLASFLPLTSESDASAMIDVLKSLHGLTDLGMAVLLLHHPRKQTSARGQSARGSGALLGFVDISLEMQFYEADHADSTRRVIWCQSRHAESPSCCVYHWSPASKVFTAEHDLEKLRYEETWKWIPDLLQGHQQGLPLQKMLELWPEEAPCPSQSRLYRCLNEAVAAKRLYRTGTGTSKRPYIYSTTRPPKSLLAPLPPLPDFG